jgi:hypothetical protein
MPSRGEIGPFTLTSYERWRSETIRESSTRDACPLVRRSKDWPLRTTPAWRRSDRYSLGRRRLPRVTRICPSRGCSLGWSIPPDVVKWPSRSGAGRGVVDYQHFTVSQFLGQVMVACEARPGNRAGGASHPLFLQSWRQVDLLRGHCWRLMLPARREWRPMAKNPAGPRSCSNLQRPMAATG